MRCAIYSRNVKTVPQTTPYPKKNYSMLHWNPSPLTAAACFCCHKLLQKSGGFSWWSFSQFLCIPRHRLASAPPLLLNLPNQWRLLLFESFTENVLLASQVLKTLFSSWLLWQLATLFFLQPLCSHQGILGGSFSLECQGPLFFCIAAGFPLALPFIFSASASS